MAFIVGALLAIAVGLFATSLGLDRDRAFYPTVMIVIAVVYILFAAMGASNDVLLRESMFASAFIFVAAVGFKTTLWWVAGALAAHGVFDFTHAAFVTNPGVPAWWPAFCATYDVTAAAYLACLLKFGRPASLRV
jgi:hypothetical protein